MAQKHKETLSVLALLAVSMIWGGGFAFSQLALDAGLTPAAIMFGRFALATALCGIVFAKQIARHYQKGQWKSGFVLGGLLFSAFFVQVAALPHTTPGNNAFLTSAYVVFVPLILWVLRKRRPSAATLLACALSLAGAGVLSIDTAHGFALGAGDALTLLCALLFAAHIVATGQMAQTIHHTVLLFLQMAVAAVLSFAAFLFTGGQFAWFASRGAVLSVAYLGVLSTFVCYLLQTVAQKHLSFGKTGMIMATEAVFGAVFSVLFGYDVPSWHMVAGGALMFAAILLSEAAATRRAKAPAAKDAPSVE